MVRKLSVISIIGVLFLAVLSSCDIVDIQTSQISESSSSSESSESSSSAQPVITLEGIYVSTAGSDENLGTNELSPLLTLQAAVNRAAELNYTNIYVASGVYYVYNTSNFVTSGITNGCVISNSGLRIYGGFSSDFQSISGDTVLDGTNRVNHVLYLWNATNIVIERMCIRGGCAIGNSTHEKGGGIFMEGVAFSILTNITLSNNSAPNVSGMGAGLFIYNSISNSISVNVTDNEKGGVGGFNANSTTLSGNFLRNKTTSSGGGVNFQYSTNLYITGNLTENHASFYGGAIYTYYCANVIIDTTCISNTISNHGGALYFDQTDGVSIYGTYSHNLGLTSGGNGGAMVLSWCSNVTLTAIVVDNTSYGFAGAVNVENSSGVKIVNSLLTNNASFGSINCSVFLWNVNGNPKLTNLMISNNIFRGNTTESQFFIVETYATASGNRDVSGQIIIDNIFGTNVNAPRLYKDYVSNNIDIGEGWTNINVPDFTGSAIASGNRVTNY